MMILLLVACKKEENVVQSIQFTNVDKGKLTIDEGETFRVKYTVEPAELETTAVLEWTSSDEEVATVKSGRIKALCPGKANITASCGNATASISVEVVPLEVTAFQLQSKVTGYVGWDLPVEVTEIEPSEASAASIQWSVEPEDLANVFVSNGQLYVTGRKPGTGVLTGEGEGVTRECTLEFKEYIAIETLSLNPSEMIEMGYGESVTIKCSITPSNASLPEVNWDVNAPANLFKEVTKNALTLKLVAGSEEGDATVTASADGRSVSVRISVKRPPVTGIATSKWEKCLSMVDGTYGNPSSFQIVAESRPEGTDASITYRSLNPSVATVSEDGVVTAKSHGVAYIALTAEDFTTYRTVYVHNASAFSWVVEYLDTEGEWQSASGINSAPSNSYGKFYFRVYDPKSKVIDPNGNEKIHFDFINVNWLYNAWIDTYYNTLPSQLQWSMENTKDHEFAVRVKDGQSYNGSFTLHFTYGPYSDTVVVGPPITVYISYSNKN